MSDEQKKSQDQPSYTGNLFSWRFSLFGLVLILVLVAIMAYRHYVLDVPFGFNEDATIEVVPDSLLQKEEPATQD